MTEQRRKRKRQKRHCDVCSHLAAPMPTGPVSLFPIPSSSSLHSIFFLALATAVSSPTFASADDSSASTLCTKPDPAWCPLRSAATVEVCTTLTALPGSELTIGDICKSKSRYSFRFYTSIPLKISYFFFLSPFSGGNKTSLPPLDWMAKTSTFVLSSTNACARLALCRPMFKMNDARSTIPLSFFLKNDCTFHLIILFLIVKA